MGGEGSLLLIFLLLLFGMVTAAFFLVPVRIILQLGGAGKDRRLRLRLEALWGLWIGDYAVDMGEDEPPTPSSGHPISLPSDWEGQLGRIFRAGEEYGRILFTVAGRVRCRRLRVEMRLGGNPAMVGMAAGLAYAAEGMAMPFLRRRLVYAAGEPRLRVVPIFREERLEVFFDCILVARSGEIIRAVWRGLVKDKGRPEGCPD